MATGTKSVLRPLVLACWLAFLLATLQAQVAASSACGKVVLRAKITRVESSPMVWSGTVVSAQEIEVEVIRSSTSKVKVRDVMRIGILLLKGEPLIEEDTPQLSSREIAVGKVLELNISSAQLRDSVNRITLEPNCVKVVNYLGAHL